MSFEDYARSTWDVAHMPPAVERLTGSVATAARESETA